MRWLGGFESIYVQMRFTARGSVGGMETVRQPADAGVESVAPLPALCVLGARLAPGVRIHLAGLALVEAGDVTCGTVADPVLARFRNGNKRGRKPTASS
jgi:hypothetical protein